MPISIPSADPGLSIPALVLALTGLSLLFLALLRLRHWRLFAASLHGCMASIFLGSGIALFLLAMNFHSYQRLSHEQAIAEISFIQLAPQKFRADLYTGDGEILLSYELLGDEWQLDARVLIWKAPATLLGLDPRYRLERISGRYRSVIQERDAARSVYALSKDEGLEIWSLVGRFEEYLPWLNAYYGSAAYLPMANAASYQISMGQTGLLARPMNQAAEQAVRKWN